MQRLDVVHPGEGDLIVGPLPAHRDGDLVLAGALERPVVRRGHAFHDLEGIDARPMAHIDKGHAVSTRAPRKWDAHATTTPRQPFATGQTEAIVTRCLPVEARLTAGANHLAT